MTPIRREDGATLGIAAAGGAGVLGRRLAAQEPDPIRLTSGQGCPTDMGVERARVL